MRKTTLSFEEAHAKIKPKRFKFEREAEPQTKATKRPIRRRPSISAWGATLKAPLNQFWRGTSKTAVEVSIDEKEKSSP
jgi:hypothetical protein